MDVDPKQPLSVSNSLSGARKSVFGLMPGWFGHLSTGTKLILWIAVALAPLGIIALLAALDSARSNASARQAAASAISRGSARALDVLFARTELTLRTAATALAGVTDRTRCQATLEALAATHSVPVQFALFEGDGRLRCATRMFPVTVPPLIHDLDVTSDHRWLSVATGPMGSGRGPEQRAIGIARFDANTIAAVAHPPQNVKPYRLVVRDQEGDAFMASGLPSTRFEGQSLTTKVPVAGELELDLTVPAQRLRASEILGVLLPILMLLAAGFVSWLVIDRLMLRPLKQLEAAVRAYRGGDSTLMLARLSTPATEIRSLADAFARMTGIITGHEADLEEGLARQTRLTREVHHRVKNNLQVVASLLNLHARAAKSGEVTAAYAAIQRRVDALAVVHRNHYAELEENRGVPLRPLIGELAANLRASAPPGAATTPIQLEIEPLYAHQDVAVPIAFLITELVEASMLRMPRAPVSVHLEALSPSRARLGIQTALLRDSVLEDADGERVGRVLTGLSRQLRSGAERDENEGRFSIEISILRA